MILSAQVVKMEINLVCAVFKKMRAQTKKIVTISIHHVLCLYL